MAIDGVQSIFAMGMMKEVLKQNLGDGLEFEMVFQTMLNTMGNSQFQLGSNNITTGDISMNTIPGQDLEKLKMIINNPYYNNTMDLNNIYRTDVNGDYKVEHSEYLKELYENEIDPQMKRIYSAVDKYSKEFDVDPKLVLAVIKCESNFDPSVKSWAGAMGLMQLMPINCKEDGVQDPYNIEQNIRGGIKQLRGHLNRYDGNVEMALMAYNAGPGTVMNRGVKSTADLYKMPEETQNYVPKVMKYYQNGIK